MGGEVTKKFRTSHVEPPHIVNVHAPKRNMLNLIMQICADGSGFSRLPPSDIPLLLHLLALPPRALRERPRQRPQRVERPQAGMAQARQGATEAQGRHLGGSSHLVEIDYVICTLWF